MLTTLTRGRLSLVCGPMLGGCDSVGSSIWNETAPTRSVTAVHIGQDSTSARGREQRRLERTGSRVRTRADLAGNELHIAGLALRLAALDLHAPARARGLDHRQRDLHDAQPVQAGRGWLAARSSPNALHAEHVVQAAEAGKHVLCEKPMATTIADAVRMLQACRRAGVTLGIAFNLRQHPAYVRARELSPPGRWDASCSPRRSGRSACAAATARRRARRSRSGGTPRRRRRHASP